MKRVAILGRGVSLKKYAKFSHLFKKIYIVGNFWKEITKLKMKHFQNKDIVHIVSRTDSPLRGNFYKKLNFIKITTPYYLEELVNSKIINKFKKVDLKIEMLPKYMIGRGYPSAPRELIIKYSCKHDNYKDLCIFLREKFSEQIEEIEIQAKRSHYWPTTGMYALDICLVENNPKEIYIFGIDCLQTLNYIVYNFDFKTTRDTDATKLMFYHIEEMVKEFSSTEFYSASSVVKLDYPNWHLI